MNFIQFLKAITLAAVLVAVSGCARDVVPFIGDPGDPNQKFRYAVDAREPCWLRVDRITRPVIRVNCFAINGVLYTHSNRMVPLANLVSESWTATVAANPRLDVLIEGRIFPLAARRVEDEVERRRILSDRHYSYIPDAIQVYALTPRR